MRDGADHASSGSARKLGVGVEGDDVTGIGESLHWASLDGEAIELAQEKLVQVQKLATLSFPAHPDSLSRVEEAVAMKKKERTALGVGVLLVEAVDVMHHQLDEGIAVFVERTRGCIGQIGEKTEVDVLVLVGEVAGLQFIAELAHLLFAQEESGDDDEGGGLGRYALRKVQLGEGLGL